MLSDRWAVRTHRNGSVIDQNHSVTFVIFSRQQADLSKYLAVYKFSSARKLPSRVEPLGRPPMVVGQGLDVLLHRGQSAATLTTNDL